MWQPLPTWQTDHNKQVVVQLQIQRIPRVWSNIYCLQSLSEPGILSPSLRSQTCSSCQRWWSSVPTPPRSCSCAGWTGSGWSSSWTHPQTPLNSWEVECTHKRTKVQQLPHFQFLIHLQVEQNYWWMNLAVVGVNNHCHNCYNYCRVCYCMEVHRQVQETSH